MAVVIVVVVNVVVVVVVVVIVVDGNIAETDKSCKASRAHISVD